MRAKRSLGQNFLQDTGVIRQIVAALELSPGETVVEVGPGRGALTEHLIETGADVLAIEIDRLLVPALRVQFHSAANFRVVEDDVLQADLAGHLTEISPASVKLIGNLPYYISTAILQKLASERALFSQAVLMLQREVVRRITAPAGDSERGFLTVITETAFDVKHLFDVPPNAFRPRPKVWSSVITLTPKPPSVGDEAAFRELVSTAFGQKRKTLLNNLKRVFPDAGDLLAQAEIDPGRRAETLALNEWERLCKSITQIHPS